jgi:hemoglobin/transferrin/lactoferrin receptor protein
MYALEGAGIAAAGSPGLPAGGAYTVDKDESRWSPKITLAATPFSWLQPYVTYSESMRAPTINEALVGGIHPGTTDVTFAPNPSLDPEVQKGWEFGFNVKQDNLLQRGDALRFKADYFTMDVENYISTCIAFSPPMTVFAQFCNARGTSKVDGVELQGTYDTGYAFGGISYTYTNTTIASQFNGFGAQSFLPDSILTLTGGLRFLNEKLTVGARGYIVSESYNGADQVQKLIDAQGLTAFVPNPNGNPKDPYNKPYELLDLFTSYKWSDTFDINATVTNVFGRSYSPALSTPVAGFTGDLGRGRTFIVSTRAQF